MPDLTKYQKLDQSSVQSAANPADEPTGRREDKDRSVHAYQICADKAPADKWTVFRGLWSSNNSLHVLEAEILVRCKLPLHSRHRILVLLFCSCCIFVVGVGYFERWLKIM